MLSDRNNLHLLKLMLDHSGNSALGQTDRDGNDVDCDDVSISQVVLQVIYYTWRAGRRLASQIAAVPLRAGAKEQENNQGGQKRIASPSVGLNSCS